MPVGKTNESKRVCICKTCGKEGQWVAMAIRDHIEAKHLEGGSFSGLQPVRENIQVQTYPEAAQKIKP